MKMDHLGSLCNTVPLIEEFFYKLLHVGMPVSGDGFSGDGIHFIL
jgi:hypothetical protein